MKGKKREVIPVISEYYFLTLRDPKVLHQNYNDPNTLHVSDDAKIHDDDGIEMTQPRSQCAICKQKSSISGRLPYRKPQRP